MQGCVTAELHQPGGRSVQYGILGRVVQSRSQRSRKLLRVLGGLINDHTSIDDEEDAQRCSAISIRRLCCERKCCDVEHHRLTCSGRKVQLFRPPRCTHLFGEFYMPWKRSLLRSMHLTKERVEIKRRGHVKLGWCPMREEEGIVRVRSSVQHQQEPGPALVR